MRLNVIKCFLSVLVAILVIFLVTFMNEELELLMRAATGKDEAVDGYNEKLAQAHGTDAPRIFSGGLIEWLFKRRKRSNSDNDNDNNNNNGAVVGDDLDLIDGKVLLAFADEDERGTRNNNSNSNDEFDEDEDSAANDPALIQVDLPKTYAKALQEDIERMVKKMPRFTNQTLKTTKSTTKSTSTSNNNSNKQMMKKCFENAHSSSKVPELEIFPNQKKRSWPGSNVDYDFHQGKLDEILGIASSASARNGFFRSEKDKAKNDVIVAKWYVHDKDDGKVFVGDIIDSDGKVEKVDSDLIGSCARKISAQRSPEKHRKDYAIGAIDYHNKEKNNIGESKASSMTQTTTTMTQKERRIQRIENLSNDPWFMFVGDSTTRHQWKTLLNTLREQGYRVAASSVKWKKPADMGRKGVDPSKEALKNRKRDQDVILIDRKNYDNVIVLSLRFLVGNHVTKAAATCADFVLNHDYVEDRWPVPEFSSSSSKDLRENVHFGIGDQEAKFETQARSLLRGRMPAGTQPSVVVLNSGLWELPSMIRERQSEFPLKNIDGGGLLFARKKKGGATSGGGGDSSSLKFTDDESEILYASRLSQLMRLFSPSVCGFRNTLFWRTTFNSQKKHRMNGEYVSRFHEHALCEARKNGVKVIDAYQIHNKLGNPNKLILTAKTPKEDKVHPSDDTQRIVNQAMLSYLCPPEKK